MSMITPPAQAAQQATITATPGATVNLSVATGSLLNVASWTATDTETVNAVGAQTVGQRLVCIIFMNAVIPVTITFGTGFKASATLVGAAAKTSIIEFVSNGTEFLEVARTLSLT